MPPRAFTESQTIESKEQVRPKRLFAFGSMRFRVSRARICDVVLDALNYAVEGFVYLIGPLLIVLALSIVGLLSYVFFFTLLPMLQLKHAESSFGNLYLGLHCTWVIFLLVNILFNYFLCVTTRHKGANYDKVVRELADATDLTFPETPEAVTQYRRDYEDRMLLRMRRRKARAAAATAETVASSGSSPNGVTQRRTAGAATSTTATTETAPKPPPALPPLRRWMLMTPFEWGYDHNSNQPKPPRSHYDHVTKKLVLNMDHYCPWMFNCSTYSCVAHDVSCGCIQNDRSTHSCPMFLLLIH
jgi:palmitoyltransferase